jgi:hypothetical protein
VKIPRTLLLLVDRVQQARQLIAEDLRDTKNNVRSENAFKWVNLRVRSYRGNLHSKTVTSATSPSTKVRNVNGTKSLQMIVQKLVLELVSDLALEGVVALVQKLVLALVFALVLELVLWRWVQQTTHNWGRY